MSWQSDLEHCLRPDEPLAPHCWLRLGGTAEFFAEPTNEDDLQKIVSRCRENNIPLRTLGGGSNLLISDEGIPGVVLSLASPAFGSVSVAGTTLTAGGGAALSHAIVSAVREGLAGLESLVSVPGTVGGALHGNAGDKIASVGSCFHEATVITRSGELSTRNRADVAFAYRQSGLDELAIVRASFQLEQESKEELARRMQKQWIVTRSEQPTREKRTACLFKDPMGQSASELIEAAGLRGHVVGGVSLFDRDPNYVIVAEEGTCDDVRRLIDEIREKINLSTGVELEQALQVW
jgi:UDP-N-acetylmuramate dehydrogenase